MHARTHLLELGRSRALSLQELHMLQDAAERGQAGVVVAQETELARAQ